MMPGMRWIVGLFVVCLIVVLVLKWRGRSSTQSHDVNAFMASLAEKVVVVAQEDFGTALDFSVESVERVEGILDKLHKEFTEGRLSEDKVSDQAIRWGAYIGEVIRRTKGGYWERDHHVAGPSSFPIHYEGHTSFPCAWCFRRICNGEEDNVWFKFQVLTLGQGDGGLVIDGAAENPK